MNTLQVAAESSWVVHAGAAAILFLHIAAGSVAIVSGSMALAFRKGGRAHVVAGNVFFVSMLVMASIGALVAPFLLTAQGNPKLFDSAAGFFTCYLVFTSWLTVRRKAGTLGRSEVAAFLYAVALAVAIVLIGTGRDEPTGYYGIGAIIALAAALDLKVILNGGIGGSPRIARHLWRMCLALFVAVGSFFLGQQRVMPEFMQGSLWLSVPPLAVLAAMLFWLLKLRFARAIAQRRRRRRPGVPAETAVPAAS
ncbi:MAG TPA: hypothetical protein VFP12_06495 [Allosphingosinicella sp.]|nr:hypothetical protein [Allosphingosinicella sp.]